MTCGLALALLRANPEGRPHSRTRAVSGSPARSAAGTSAGSSSVSARARCSSTASVWWTRFCPAGVRVTRRPARVSSATPASRSRVASCRETAEGAKETARATAAGAAGLAASGTTGEAPLLCPHEKKQVLEICARVCRDHGATLIAGAGGSTTAHSAHELEELAGIADAALVPTPPFVRPSPGRVGCWHTSRTWPNAPRCP